jgi:hypothetical protein
MFFVDDKKDRANLVAINTAFESDNANIKGINIIGKINRIITILE